MNGHDIPVPVEVVERVDQYVENELRDADRYENREPLDESGIWSLHGLVADAYAFGWAAGARAEARRADGRRQREREAARRAAEKALAEGVSD